MHDVGEKARFSWEIRRLLGRTLQNHQEGYICNIRTECSTETFQAMVVHVNALKPRVDMEASVLRVVVADDDPEEDSDGTGELTAQQQKDIKNLLQTW